MPAIRSVTPRVLQDRLASLARELSGRDDALALLALGSVGTETARLDAWSDLDFFVLVRDGQTLGQFAVPRLEVSRRHTGSATYEYPLVQLGPDAVQTSKPAHRLREGG